MTGTRIDDVEFEYATALGRQALQHMAHHRVPSTPENFSVWFKYASGTAPELKKAIDVLIGNKRAFDAATNRDLFDAYANAKAADGSVKSGISDQLSTLMSSAQQFLVAAIDDSRMQMRTLDGVTAQAASGGDPRALIQNLMKELSRATERATALESNFADASNELEKIRESLEQAEQRSRTDTLTGLANRRALDEFLRIAQIRAMESGDPLCTLMIDIDHFKKFNDNYGHQVGDQVIKLMANVLREHVRENDLAARYGGEELTAVLPGATLDVCHRIAERIRSAVSERRIRRRTTGEEISSITISVGVAEFRPGESAESLVERADRALYLAKKSGRNRVMTENDLDRDVAAA